MNDWQWFDAYPQRNHRLRTLLCDEIHLAYPQEDIETWAIAERGGGGALLHLVRDRHEEIAMLAADTGDFAERYLAAIVRRARKRQPDAVLVLAEDDLAQVLDDLIKEEETI